MSAGTGLFFMAVYHACNLYAAQSGRTRTWCWDWELSIPVVPWLIVPYWSIDLQFCIAPFLCASRSELRVLAGRVVLATVLAAACFLAWPLTLAHVRTNEHGVFTPLFTAINGFDQPHNLFPSLHVAFAFILRWTYHKHLRGALLIAFHLWFAAITVSTVLVHQHHLIDVIGGLLLAIACCYTIAEAPLPTGRHRLDRRALRHGGGFALGALGCLGLAWWGGDWWWFLAWPAVALAIVSTAYFGVGPTIFHKRQSGLPFTARAMLAPYLLGLGCSRRWWWWRDSGGAQELTDGVWIGRLPNAATLTRLGIRGVLDLTGEHNGIERGPDLIVEHLPLLDLATPDRDSLVHGATLVEALRQHGPVLIHCGLGYGRTAGVAAAWLLTTGRAAGADRAAKMVSAARPGSVLHQLTMAELVGLERTPSTDRP